MANDCCGCCDCQCPNRPKLAAAEREVAEFKERWVGACATVAEMHAAAVGEVRGPDRGVIQDVADLRARALAAERARDEAVAALRANGPALQYADEVIHGEFCGFGCHSVCKEFRALANRARAVLEGGAK